MEKRYEGKMVRIFIEGKDKYKHEPLYKAIIEKLKDCGVSGGTVIRGIEGFGEAKQIHEDFLEVLARELPIVIETIVKDENFEKMIEVVSPMMKSGKIAVVDKVSVLSFE